MNEKLVEQMLSDRRVESFLIGDIHALKAIPDQVKKIIVYCQEQIRIGWLGFMIDYIKIKLA